MTATQSRIIKITHNGRPDGKLICYRTADHTGDYVIQPGHPTVNLRTLPPPMPESKPAKPKLSAFYWDLPMPRGIMISRCADFCAGELKFVTITALDDGKRDREALLCEACGNLHRTR